MDKKRRILLSMLELVVIKGYYATSISILARKAHVTESLIYYYFTNKQHIIEELYLLIVEDFSVILTNNLKVDDNFETQFKTVGKNLYNYYVSNPLAFKFIEFIAIPPIISETTINATKTYYLPITNYFLKGIKDKHIKDLPLKMLIQFCYGNVVSAVKLKIHKELEMNSYHLEQAINITWNAVKH